LKKLTEYRLKILLLLLTLHSGTVHALRPDRALSQYMLDSWSTADGLPRNGVEAVHQTRDGQLWVGSMEGFAHFDGWQFLPSARSEFPELQGFQVLALEEDRGGGQLWAGIFGEGLLRYDQKKSSYELFNEEQGLCGDDVTELHVDADGALWIGTDSNGLCHLVDGQFQSVEDALLAKGRVVGLTTDPRGRLYVAASTDELLLVEPGSRRLQALPGLPAPASAVLADGQGGVWVGTYGRGVFRFDRDQGVFQPAFADSLGQAIVRNMMEDGDGNLWIGTTSHLCRITARHAATVAPQDIMPFPLVTSMTEDSEGSVWIATQSKGVHRFREGRLYTISRANGLEEEDTWALHEAHDGAIWVGTAGDGLYRLQDSKAHRVKGFPAGSIVLSLYEDPQAVLWAGLYGGGVLRFEGGKARRLTEALSGERVSVIQGDSSGDIWVGTFGAGLNRLNGQGIPYAEGSPSLPGQTITALRQTRDGRLWVGTRGAGVRVLDQQDEQVEQVLTVADGLCHDHVHSIFEASDGSVWLGTADGLCAYQEPGFASIRKEHGLPDFPVLDIVEDDAGNLWLSTPRGIVRVRRGEISRFFKDKSTEIETELFDVSDGMANRECNGGTQPNAIKSSNGTIYVATVGGVVGIEADYVPRRREPPTATIAGILVDETLVELHAGQNALQLQPGTSRVEIRFSTRSHLYPEKPLFRYKLDGTAQDWIDCEGQRKATFGRLNPGRHRLYVSASYGHDEWSKPVRFVLLQEPYFYERSSFYLACAAGLLSLVGLAFWAMRRRYQREQADLEAVRAELERTVEEKTAELKEITLVDPLTGLRNRRFVSEVIVPEVVAYGDRRERLPNGSRSRDAAADTETYGIYLFDIDHFKRINDTLGHDAGDRMLQQFSWMLGRSVRQDDFVVRWGGEEFLVVLRATDPEHLDRYAQRMRKTVEETTFLVTNTPQGALNKTCSIGYVSLPFFHRPGWRLEFEQAVMLADLALYYAKESGRNRAIRLVPTGKRPDASDLAQLLRSLDYGLDKGLVEIRRF